ncbi:MAG TPA: hypothetical protein VKE92_00070, partial [Anaerolineales bacterium]|nr:hypothetical protein [Anaerolineales bacterium]
MGDAIAKAVQQRFYHAITALEGEETAKNVVGELYTATAQNIQGIQARAMEALQILSTIADFQAGDLSQTAQQIRSINQEFQNLKDRATVLGLPVDEIMAEQQRQIEKITTDFNQGIGDAILGITDPVKLEFIELQRMQEERRQNAIDAGADLTQLTKLEQLEREELEKRHQQKVTDITEAGGKEREAAINNIFQAIWNIEDPLKAALLSIQLQVEAFQAQADQGLIPQSLVDRFETSATEQVWENERRRKEEEAQAIEEFNQDIYNSILAMKDANAAELAEMDRMHAERYQKAMEMGADLNAVAELNHAERLAKEQEHQDTLTEIQEQARQ